MTSTILLILIFEMNTTRTFSDIIQLKNHYTLLYDFRHYKKL